MILHIFEFLIAVVAGTLVSEFFAFSEKQSVYKRGSDTSNFIRAWKHQFNAYMIDRWDDLGKTFFIGIVLAGALFGGANTEVVTEFILGKLGFENATLHLGGAALCGLILSFGRLLLKGLGVVKGKKES